MPLKDITAALNVSVSGERDVSSLSEAMEDLGEKMAAVAGVAEGAEESVEDLEEEIEDLTRESGEASGSLSALQAEIVATSTAAKSFDSDAGSLARQLDDLDDAVADIALDKVANSFEDATAKALFASEQAQEAVDAVKDLDNDTFRQFLDQFKDADSAAEALESFNKETDNAARKFERIEEVVDNINDVGAPSTVQEIRKLYETAGKEGIEPGSLSLNKPTSRREALNFSGPTTEKALRQMAEDELAGGNIPSFLEDLDEDALEMERQVQAFSDLVESVPNTLRDGPRSSPREFSDSEILQRALTKRASELLEEMEQEALSGDGEDFNGEFTDREGIPKIRRDYEDDDQTTIIDAVEEIHEGITEGSFSKEFAEAVKGGPPTTESGEIDFEKIRSDVGLDGESLLDSIDVDQSDIESVAKAMNDLDDLLADLEEELVPALESMAPDDTLADVVEELDGKAAREVADFADEYEEVFDELFDEELLTDMLEVVDSPDDLAKRVSKELDGEELNVFQRSLLSEVMGELRGGMVKGTDPGSGKPIPREVLMGQILQRTSEVDTEAQKQQYFKLYRKIARGDLGLTQALPTSPDFQESLEESLTKRLRDVDTGDNDPRSLSRSITERMNEAFSGEDAEGQRRMLTDILRGDRSAFARIAGDALPPSLRTGDTGDNILRETAQATDAARRAMLKREVPGLLPLLEAQGVSPVRVQKAMGTGIEEQPGIPSLRALRDDEVGGDYSPEDTYGYITGRMREIREGRGHGFIEPETMVTKSLRSLEEGAGIELTAEKFNKATDSVRKFRSGLQELVPVLGATSLSLGPLTFQLGNLAKQFIGFVGLFGSAASALLGFAGAATAATVSLGAFVGVGAVGVLDAIKQQMAGVNSKTEAASKLFEHLRGEAMKAMEPLKNAQLGGDGVTGFQAFIDLLNFGLEQLNNFAVIAADIVEMEEVQNLVEGVSSALQGDGTGEFATALKEMVAVLAPLVEDFLVYLIENMPEFISFVTTIAKRLKEWGPALANIVELLGPIITYGSYFLQVMSILVRRITDAITVLNDLIPFLDVLAPIFGVLAGMVVAYNIVLGTAIYLTTSVIGVLSSLAGALITVASTLNLVGALWVYAAPVAFIATALAAAGAITYLGGTILEMVGIVDSLETGLLAVGSALAGVVALFSLSNPVGWLFLAVSALTLIYENLNGIVSFFEGLWNGLVNLGAGIYNFVIGPFQDLLDILHDIANMFSVIPGLSPVGTGGASRTGGTGSGQGPGPRFPGGQGSGSGRGGGGPVIVNVQNNGAIGPEDFVSFIQDQINSFLRSNEQRSGPNYRG